MDEYKYTSAAIESGADGAAVVNVRDILFKREFRAACERNSCGKYGKCWMCPPDVGEIDEMINRARGYRHALVVQSIGRLEDSFDIEGMEYAAKRHNSIIQTLAAELDSMPGDSLKLGAGACRVCERCARADEESCRNPDKAIASLEAYGIAVSELSKTSGMNYVNGPNTVTFFGVFLFK